MKGIFKKKKVYSQEMVAQGLIEISNCELQGHNFMVLDTEARRMTIMVCNKCGKKLVVKWDN